MARRTRAEQQQETRRRLLVAAQEVFEEVGYQAATVEEIASRAGFTRGAVYGNFPAGKADLFLALLGQSDEARGERLRRAMAELDDDAFAEAYPELLRPRPPSPGWQRATTELLASARDDPQLRERLAEHLRGSVQGVARLFEEQLSAAGAEPPIPATELALLAIALSNGLSVVAGVAPELVPVGFEVRMIDRVIAAPPEVGQPPAPPRRRARRQGEPGSG